ncbi:hypothetical protein REY83_004812 [Klebsiella aerogenes]|nr:hypothetical protein [Klebsiella aerogenes]EKZ6548480.1 hypothetical protein [Klebsiella aerogenes]EKZ6676757.1 hypothetical protein [Klebsiella aerogenes]
MSKIIITKNNYFRIALSELMQKYNAGNSYYAIDLDCSTNLDKLLSIFSRCEEKNCTVFLFGSRGVYAELFSCFNVISMNQSVEAIASLIRKNYSTSPVHLIEYIASCHSLTRLSTSQIKICLLDRKQNISLALEMLVVNRSTIYRHINMAASKYNFDSLVNFRCFISREFCNADLELLASSSVHSFSA